MTDQDNKTSPIKVMVVDDSAFMRLTISKHLNSVPGISVVTTARDGKDALELIPKFNPDVITLDVEMPRMDGLTTLREIMKRNPLPVIMVSSLTSEGTIETVQALTLGAVDFIAKPSFTANISAVVGEIGKKIKRASKARVWQGKRRNDVFENKFSDVKKSSSKVRDLQDGDKIVFIGSSTGGPRALNFLVPKLSEKIPAAYIIVQHMPAGFTRSLAERLDQNSFLQIKEAEPGDTIKVGQCLVAPGGFHMLFDKSGNVVLNQNPPVHGVRPAIDVTLISAVQNFKNKFITVILTGMGSDGTSGAALAKEAGGKIIAESEESSVVWGMPRSIVEAGLADQVLDLNDIPQSIIESLE